MVVDIERSPLSRLLPRNSASQEDGSSTRDPQGSVHEPLSTHFDGPHYGTRIAPPLVGEESIERLDVGKQVEMEADNPIKYRTCSWQKAAALLFSEYIGLAVMSFPHSYSILGLFPGILLTIVVAGVVLYTSLVLWRFCLRHPEVRDVCDIGQMLFWNSKIAWYMTAAMFLLNNTFIMGLHCLVGAQYLNTMTQHGACTIAFAGAVAILSFVCSLPRTFSSLSKLASLSAFFTFLSLLLAVIFSAIEPHPANYNPDPNVIGRHGKPSGEPIVSAFPQPGTTFVAGMSAFLNISYALMGQITLPSFIAEMTQPEDFYKSLLVVTFGEVVLFCVVGGVIFGYTGTQYMTSPAFGSLGDEYYKKISFSFMIPTLIFLGVLYASVSARFMFFRLFDGSQHTVKHTLAGWSAWSAILASLWILAFVVAEVIPFFSDLLSIMGAIFDSFFGFIFWGLAYLRMRKADHGPYFYRIRGMRGWIGFVVNIALVGAGLFFLGPGTYASVQSVIDNYREGDVGGAFSCADNGL